MDVTGVAASDGPSVHGSTATGLGPDVGNGLGAGERTEVDGELSAGGTINSVGPGSAGAASGAKTSGLKAAPAAIAELVPIDSSRTELDAIRQTFLSWTTIVFSQCREAIARGKDLRARAGWAFFAGAWSLVGCTGAGSQGAVDPQYFRLMMDSPPLTLNPRATLDAGGQKIGALMFRGLVREDSEMNLTPDLAAHWESSNGGKRWRFWLKALQRDHAGQPIDGPRMLECLEQYRAGKPLSGVGAGVEGWQSTRLEDGNQLVFELSKANPYFPKETFLLRYFTVEGKPCVEPGPQSAVVTSGPFRPEPWQIAPELELVLAPLDPTFMKVRLSFVRDETSRALKLLKGDVDATQNGLTLTKTRWLQTQYSDQFEIVERPGTVVSYLALNVRDPALAKLEVRRAITAAINRESIVKYKMFGFGQLAGSLLAPNLPESHATPFAYDPTLSEHLLDTAGYPRGPDGVRLRLHYRTTPIREGAEAALILREMLGKVGIELTLDVVEPAVFLASIRKGSFQMYSSRWVGVSNGTILFSTLHSGQSLNRGGYKNAHMDELLDAAMAEEDPARRVQQFAEVQTLAGAELPFVPLWFWTNAVITRKEYALQIRGKKLSLSGGLEPLVYIRKLAP